MGVSGSGKSTVGWALSQRLGWPFFDGDDFHSEENVSKMARGIALTDADRKPWLDRLSELISKNVNDGRSVVVACSALKRAYRDRLREAAKDILIAYLQGDYILISRRMRERPDHLMKTDMLRSQLASLEEPDNALTINSDQDVNVIVDELIKRIPR
jgi:gluconokinase